MGVETECCVVCDTVAALAGGRRPSSTSERRMSPVLERQSRFARRRVCDAREVAKEDRCTRAELIGSGGVSVGGSFGSWVMPVVSCRPRGRDVGSADAMEHEPARETKFPIGLSLGSGVKAKAEGGREKKDGIVGEM
jgi:hypothetical protein